MHVIKLQFIILFCLITPFIANAGEPFIAIAYHDIVKDRGDLTIDAVSLDNLVDHFEWIKANNYHPVSVDDIIASNQGKKPLPPNALLLCWDDGYRSFYDYVFPLLKAYQYPAILALVGSWMTADSNGMVEYGTELVPRSNFMTWQQVKEVHDSGLVEIASHSHGLHAAVVVNPAGDTLPAATGFQYNPSQQHYETRTEFRERIHEDLVKSRTTIEQQVGVQPRVLVWPFGRYNAISLAEATAAGMGITFTLTPVSGDTRDLSHVGRTYPSFNPDLKTFQSLLSLNIRPPVRHFVKVDSKDLLEPEDGKEQHFNAFLDRMKDLSPSMVIIEPVVTSSTGSGALFPNTRYPLIQDRLRRISWHTAKKGGTGVFFWLQESLFQPREYETPDTVSQFFSDMGKSGPGEGLIIDSPQLIEALLETLPPTPLSSNDVLHWNPTKQRLARQQLLSNEASVPTSTVISRTLQSLETFQQWQPFQEIALVIDTQTFKSLSEKQLFHFFNLFDFLIINAADDSVITVRDELEAQLASLHQTGLLRKCALFFSSQQNKGEDLAKKLHDLPQLNIINWGYKTDHFLEALPSSISIRPLLLKKSFPYPIRYHY